jgi:NADPH-dependent curcumin reductase CurA
VTETRQWLLNGHPRGRPINDDDLKLATTSLPNAGPGQMLLKTHFLGFDPAQKGWMENIADRAMAIGDVMRGSASPKSSQAMAASSRSARCFRARSVGGTSTSSTMAMALICMSELPPTAMLSIGRRASPPIAACSRSANRWR